MDTDAGVLSTTVTLHVVDRYLPLLFFCVAFTVIVAVPVFLAVTFPLLLTVATALLLLVHFTGQYTPAGFTAAFSVFVFPTTTVALTALTLTLLGFKFLTVILPTFFTFLFFLDVTVMFTFPAFLPVTTPLEDTVAIFLLLDL